MSRETSYLKFPFPSPLEEPFIESMDGFVQNVDANMFSTVTDRNLIITGGGNFFFDLANETLSWEEPILLNNFITGFMDYIPAGFVILRDGEFLYTRQVRRLEDATGALPLETITAAKLLNTSRRDFHVDTMICFRFGDRIIFRNGRILPAGISVKILTEPFLGEGRRFVFSRFVGCQYFDDTLRGVADGVNQDFFFGHNAIDHLIAFYADGLRLTPVGDYDYNDHRITINLPPDLGAQVVIDLYEPQVVFEGVYNESNIWSEIPGGAVDGLNPAFTTFFDFAAATVCVYQNGLRMKPGTDYTITGTKTFQFAVPPAVGAKILVDYVMTRTGISEFTSYLVFNEPPVVVSPTLLQTANAYHPETIRVYLDGMRLKRGVDYVETPSNSISLSSPAAPATVFLVDYNKAI